MSENLTEALEVNQRGEPVDDQVKPSVSSLDRLTVGRRAQRDIRSICQESAARWWTQQAARYSTVIDAATERIAAHPEIGIVQPMVADV